MDVYRGAIITSANTKIYRTPDAAQNTFSVVSSNSYDSEGEMLLIDTPGVQYRHDKNAGCPNYNRDD